MLDGGLQDRSLIVDHTCRNRWCCNPAHLSCGSQKDNMATALASRKPFALGQPCKKCRLPIDGANAKAANEGYRCRNCYRRAMREFMREKRERLNPNRKIRKRIP
jgi:hypothetical protein